MQNMYKYSNLKTDSHWAVSNIFTHRRNRKVELNRIELN